MCVILLQTKKEQIVSVCSGEVEEDGDGGESIENVGWGGVGWGGGGEEGLGENPRRPGHGRKASAKRGRA